MSETEIAVDLEDFHRYPLDAIVVLGVDIQIDSSGKLVINKNQMGARSRAIATKEAYEKSLASIFLITGGRQTDDNGHQSSKAELLAEFIAQGYNVPKDNLLPIGEVGNTMGNAEDAARFFSENPDRLNKHKVGILTNEFHMPRAIIMFQNHPFFASRHIQIVPVIAEDLISHRSPHHAKWVDQLRSNPRMEDVLIKEVRGIKDFVKGNYASTHS